MRAAYVPNWSNLPAACRILNQWVLWRPEVRDGKTTKVPLDRFGRSASTTASHTWCALSDAAAALKAGKGDGVGFVFTRQSRISGIDLDHCRDPSTERIDLWAQEIIKRFNSYTEISPSGEGVHIIIKGSLPAGVGGKKRTLKGEGYRPNAAIEIYSEGRYFTFTGNRLQDISHNVEDRQDVLVAVYNEIFGVEEPQAKAAEKPHPEPQDEPEKPTVAAGEDSKILEKILARPEIARLFNGDISGYNGDDSGADLALCNHLAFWTNGNREQIDRLFRQSKLFRPKWDEKRGKTTYGERTIDEAVKSTTEGYQPSTPHYQPVVEGELPAGIRKWADNLPPYVPAVDVDGIAYHRAKASKDGESGYVKIPICDGYAYISEETRDDQGEATFTIEGRCSVDGHKFKFDISGRDFSDPRKLKAALTAHFGARNRVKSLTGEVIQDLTLDVKKLTLITSPKWIGGKLAVPGLDGSGFKFRIPARIPVDLSTGEEEKGLEALRMIMEIWPAEKAAVAVTTDLASPLCGRWFVGDRFGLALTGTTGRGLKTEMLKLLMAVYGAGFLSEDALLRWGEGATGNAMLAIASGCGCLPTAIDNYKPHRDSASKFVQIVHTILEGRERERLNRNAELREAREYATTLFVTGEDLPEEASTVARLLPVEWSTPPRLEKLTKLQQIAHHLPAVGRIWCRYLQDVDVDMDKWRESRSKLVDLATKAGAINPGRIGTTAAILKLVWEIALSSPLKDALKDRTADFETGLIDLIASTSKATKESTEASQFVDALKELISSGRSVVLERVYTGNDISLPNTIGWKIASADSRYAGCVAILPRLALDAVRRVNGPQAREREISPNSLYRQLEEAGLIAGGSGEGQRLAVQRIGSKTVRVLMFKPNTIIDDGAETIDLSSAASRAVEDAEKRQMAEGLEAALREAVKIATPSTG